MKNKLPKLAVCIGPPIVFGLLFTLLIVALANDADRDARNHADEWLQKTMTLQHRLERCEGACQSLSGVSTNLTRRLKEVSVLLADTKTLFRQYGPTALFRTNCASAVHLLDGIEKDLIAIGIDPASFGSVR